jgi:hypothetical protein
LLNNEKTFLRHPEQLKVFGQSEHQKVKNNTASTINKEKWSLLGHF